MYYKKIVGENLYLSPVDIDNEVKYMTEWLNEDEDIMYHNGFYKSVLNEDKTRDMLNKWNEGPYMFSIINNDNEFMGHVSLFNINDYSVTLGIYIGKKHRHLGYGKQAMNLVKDYIFNDLNKHSIHLEVFSYNKKALKFYTHLGYKICGVWHKERYAKGEYHDVYLLEYLKEE